jgi:transcription initiation factor TFIIF subunit beta
MDIVNYDVHNTFIFTEQDLPSFAAKNKEKANALAQGIPAHLLRKQYNKTEQAPDTARKGAPYGRRPIPSQFAPRPLPQTMLLTSRVRENKDCRQDQA